MTIRDMPPRGHYLAHEVGRLAGVSGRMIGQWARRGYIHSSQSDKSPRIYSYQDVAEAMVVHELIEAGVSHQTIRDAIAHLREQHPLGSPGLRMRSIAARPELDAAFTGQAVCGSCQETSPTSTETWSQRPLTPWSR